MKKRTPLTKKTKTSDSNQLQKSAKITSTETTTRSAEHKKEIEVLTISGHRDLIDFVDKQHVTCQNLKSGFDITCLFAGNDKLKSEGKEIVFKKHDLICRRAPSEGYYYYGKIEKIVNGKYTIEYGDGERDKNVKCKFIHRKIKLQTNDEIEAQLVEGKKKYYKCRVQQSNIDGTNLVMYQNQLRTIHLLYVRISITLADAKETEDTNDCMDVQKDMKEKIYLESDCDAQLLLSIPLLQPIKLHTIRFSIENPLEITDPRSLRTILLYINKPFLDFNEAENLKAIKKIELEPHQLTHCKSSMISLPYAKLQNVNHLTLFITNNQGDAETTVLSNVVLLGQPAPYMDMKNHKRDRKHHFSGYAHSGGWIKAPGCD